jgi:glutamate formiminotransferase
MCEINAVIDRVMKTKIVLNSTSSINEALIEMGIPNTTGEDPSNDKKFIKKMERAYSALSKITFLEIAQDTDTNDTFILIKREDYSIHKILKQFRKTQRIHNRKDARIKP